MKSNRIQKAELVGIAAVVLSLLFVAFQIQQANRIAIATTEIEVTNNYSSLNEFMMENTGFNEVYLRLGEEGAEPTEAERMVYGNFVRRLMNIWRGVETAYQNGMLPESTYSLIEDDARNILVEESSSGTREIWRETLDIYPGLRNTELYVMLYRLLDIETQ